MSEHLTTRDRMLYFLQQQKELQAKADQEEQAKTCPWHYRKTVMMAAEDRFRSKGITLGASVAAAKNSAQVAAILVVRGKSTPGYRNVADCQAAYEQNLDPEQLGRELVDDLVEQIEDQT